MEGEVERGGKKTGTLAKSSSPNKKKVSNSSCTLNNKTENALLSELPVLQGSGAKTLVGNLKQVGV